MMDLQSLSDASSISIAPIRYIYYYIFIYRAPAPAAARPVRELKVEDALHYLDQVC